MYESALVLGRWLSTALLVVLPFTLLRFLSTRILRRRPEWAASLSFVIALAAPVLAIAVTAAASALHWEWLSHYRPPHGHTAPASDILVVITFLSFLGIPVLGSLLRLATQVRRQGRMLPAGELRNTRILFAIVSLVLLSVWACTALLRSWLPIHTPFALLPGSVIFASAYFLLGPALVRIMLRPARESADEERLSGADALLRAEGLPRYRLEVGDAPGGVLANALAVGPVPGLSRIVLTRSLVDTLSAEEITAVVAHEIGHIKRWHLAKLFAFNLLLILILVPATRYGLSLVEVGLLYPLIMVSTWILVSFVLLPALLAIVSRRFEREADRFASDRGFGPLLASALSKLASAHAARHIYTGLEAVFATHPSPAERIAALSARRTPQADQEPARVP